jgi:PTS system nitrogen regulatory IIA component
MTLADFTRPGLVVSHLRGRDAPGVIHELSVALQREGVVPDLLPFYHAALNREFLLRTDLGSGLACPHARLPGLPTLAFACGCSDEPLVWNPHFSHPVRLVFLIAAPVADASSYLSLLSGIAQLSQDRGRLQNLRTAANVGDFLEILSQVPVRRPASVESAVRAVAI